jgi:hypothetical protein
MEDAMTLFDAIDALSLREFVLVMTTMAITAALVWFGCRMLRHPR